MLQRNQNMKCEWRIQEFCYLDSTLDKNGGIETELSEKKIEML